MVSIPYEEGSFFTKLSSTLMDAGLRQLRKLKGVQAFLTHYPTCVPYG